MTELQITLPESMVETINETAKNRGVTPEEYIQEVLKAMLKQFES